MDPLVILSCVLFYLGLRKTTIFDNLCKVINGSCNLLAGFSTFLVGLCKLFDNLFLPRLLYNNPSLLHHPPPQEQHPNNQNIYHHLKAQVVARAIGREISNGASGEERGEYVGKDLRATVRLLFHT
ncbi:MAG: hypothetical protein LQ343_000987 [Gyalolechia ehrenbergii]|nr:MAG: hypothetical protein LQ343_000987 [Gyalolechia ehrenbergii]